MAEYTQAGGPLRQSLLRVWDQCPLRAVREAHEQADFSTPPAALGTAFHKVAETILTTLRVTGEPSMPHQEAIECMIETLARPDCPHISDQQMRELRIMVVQFTHHHWNSKGIIALEERLFADVPCPDGKVRVLTGTPDVLIAASSIVIDVEDFKTSWAVPPAPRDGDWEREAGRPYLSERGVFQLDTLGYLVFRNFPAVKRARLRERYVRVDEERVAYLDREPDLEHVERRLGVLLMRLDMGLAGELETEPRPGKWCSHCDFARSCPVPAEQRGTGTIATDEQADAEAARYVMVDGLRKQLRGALKERYGATGRPSRVGDGTALSWGGGAGGAFEIVPEEDEVTA